MTSAWKIFKKVELESLRFTNLRFDFMKHDGRTAAIVKQLETMQSSMDLSSNVGIFVAPIDVDEVRLVIATIETL